MQPFSFIHAADLHIDSPFRGISATETAPKSLGEALYASTFAAFDALVETTLEQEADFLLIAGDVYDGRDRSLRAQLKLRDGLAQLSDEGVSTFVVHGNHDPLDSHVSAIEWPEKTHFFGRKLETLEARDRRDSPVALISGISYRSKEESRNLARQFSGQETALFQIGLLHSNVDSDGEHENYAPCSLADLRDAGMDYWALGHVHTRRTPSESPWAVYPGNIQGRSIREQGPRGCYHVRVDEEGSVSLEFIALDVVRWTDVIASIDGVGTIDSLERSLVASIDAVGDEAEDRGVVCSVRIEGRGSLHSELWREGASEQVLERVRERLAGRDPFVWVQRLQLDTHPEIDISERMTRQDLLGEVLSLAQQYEKEPESLVGLYEEAMSELWGNSRVEKAQLSPPTSEEILGALRGAELLCVDQLEAEA